MAKKKKAATVKAPGRKKQSAVVGQRAKRTTRGVETKDISVRLPLDVVAWLDKQALVAGISRSAMIDRAFRFAMATDKAVEESGLFDEMFDELKRAISEQIAEGIAKVRKEGSRV